MVRIGRQEWNRNRVVAAYRDGNGSRLKNGASRRFDLPPVPVGVSGSGLEVAEIHQTQGPAGKEVSIIVEVPVRSPFRFIAKRAANVIGTGFVNAIFDAAIGGAVGKTYDGNVGLEPIRLGQ